MMENNLVSTRAKLIWRLLHVSNTSQTIDYWAYFYEITFGIRQI